MQKYSMQQNMQFIADTCKKQGFNDHCFMIAKAKVESTLNNLAKNGKYVGLFQLGDGVGGVKGNDRLDPVKSTVGALKYLEANKTGVKKAIPNIAWKNYYGYLCHQQGLYGFIAEYKNRDKTIAWFQKHKDKWYRARGKALVSNTPKGTHPVTVQDFFDIWEKRFTDAQSSCDREYACVIDESDNMGGLSNANACPLDLGVKNGIKSVSEQKAQDDMILYGSIGLAVVGAGYIFYKANKSKVDKQLKVLKNKII